MSRKLHPPHQPGPSPSSPPANVAPFVVVNCVLTGTPKVGFPISYAGASVGGNPTPTLTSYRYAIDGVDVGTVSTPYVPVSGDVGKTLTVHELWTNSAGTITSTSAGTVVIANAGPLSAVGGQAMNAANIRYYAGEYPFIDIMKIAAADTTTVSGTFTNRTDLWIDALSAGGAIRWTVITNLTNFSYFPVGDYKIVSTSAATISLDLIGSGITNVVTGVGTCTFTVTDPGAWSGFRLFVNMKNNTGAPIDIHDCYICLASEEASLIAGGIFKTQYLTDHSKVKAIRFMDWGLGNSNPISAFSQYSSTMVETKRTYAGPTAPVPVTIMTKLAKALGCALWITMLPCSKQRAFRYTAATSLFTCVSADNATVGNHYFINGERVMYLGYNSGNTRALPLTFGSIAYVINATATTYQLSLTSGGPALSLAVGADSIPSQFSYSQFASLDTQTDRNTMVTTIATDIFSTWPDAIVFAEGPNETWNSGFDQYRYAQWAASYLATGATQNWPAGYAWQCLQIWAAFEAVIPPAQVIRTLAGQAAGFSGAGQAFEYTDPGFITAGQKVKALMPIARSCYAIAPYITGTGPSGTIRPSPTQVIADNGGSSVIPDSYWLNAFTKGLTTATGWVNSSVSGAHAKVANLPIVWYEGGYDWFFQGFDANGTVIGAQLKTWIDSPASATVYSQMYQALCVVPGLKLINQYNDYGSYTFSNTFWQFWSLKSTATNTPRSTFFQGI